MMVNRFAGGMSDWMDTNTGRFNYTGLEESIKTKGGMFYGISSMAVVERLQYH
jgi:beta-glucosidase